jgi:aspartate racemase
VIPDHAVTAVRSGNAPYMKSGLFQKAKLLPIILLFFMGLVKSKTRVRLPFLPISGILRKIQDTARHHESPTAGGRGGIWRVGSGLLTRTFPYHKEQGMKTIGLIGGMSWESSMEYYRLVNETTQARLGGLHSARSIMYSVDFGEIEVMQHEGRWPEAGRMLGAVAKSLENAGADFILLCTNTMHKVANEIEAAIRIPLLHIADATARKIRDCGLTKIGLLGTRFTMEEDFYSGRLESGYGLKVIVPTAQEREIVHRVIYDELCVGRVRPGSRSQYVAIMEQLVKSGAEGVILGCTEIGLLVRDEDSPVPLFDTTKIHAAAAVDYALEP